MGIDANIFVKADGPVDVGLPAGYSIQPLAGQTEYEFYPAGATHRVDTCDRYYGKGYERGPWPRLCHALLALLSEPAVKAIWYGGDDSDIGVEHIFTHATLLGLCDHWIDNGNRPWQNIGHLKQMPRVMT